MRILVVGAGAIGGYFGGRLLQGGRDVTFLVRARRAAELADSALVIRSPTGDVTLRDPPTILAESVDQPYDLVVLSCKAYDLASAIDSIEAAVGPQTMILPLLNGMRHLDVLIDRFGRSTVLGGQCVIGATLNAQREVVQLNEAHSLTFGELDGGRSERMDKLAGVLANAGFDAHPSERILQDMWEKWVFLATLAGSTCMMRGSIGHILAAVGGEELILALFDECRAIADSESFAPRAEFVQRSRRILTTTGSPITSSMLRDIESHSRIEADHIAGDLLRRAGGARARAPVPLLRLALSHMKTYEARRSETLAAAAAMTSGATN